jgi:hypothetical protein
MSERDIEVGVFAVLMAVVLVLGFGAARWRRPENPHSLEEWGVGGRAFGNWAIWFLIGGSMYSANMRIQASTAGHTTFSDPAVRNWSAARHADSSAVRVRSSESGIRCPYTRITRFAFLWPSRSATATTDSPACSSTLA